MDSTERGILNSSTKEQFIHDNNQIQSYQRYYGKVSLYGIDSIKI